MPALPGVSQRAAAHLTRHLETEQATLHVRAGRQKEVAKALTFVHEENGPLTLLERYGRGEEHFHTHLPGVARSPTGIWTRREPAQPAFAR